MFYTYTTGRNLYGKLTKDTSTDNLSFGDQRIDDNTNRILGMKDWYFTHVGRTDSTVASTQFYPLPYDTKMLQSVYIAVDTQRYVPKQAPTREFWDRLNDTQYTSDIVEYYYIVNGQIGFFPVPSTSSNTINYQIKARQKPMSIADYSTGTITTATNGDATIVGSGTTWTSAMVGRILQIPTGDNLQYKIASVTSTTELELETPYGGDSIAGGSEAYTIGQTSLLPDGYQDIPIYLASADFWDLEGDARGVTHRKIGEDKLQQLIAEHSNSSTNMIIDDGCNREPINPNLFISL